jgi:hypothetical protein
MRLLPVLLLLCTSCVAHGQWFDFHPIVRPTEDWFDEETGETLSLRLEGRESLRINDAGQAVWYAVGTLVDSERAGSSNDTGRIYVDDKLVYRGDIPSHGDINNAGQFAFLRGCEPTPRFPCENPYNLVLGDAKGNETNLGDVIKLRDPSHRQEWTAHPKIDENGNVFSVGLLGDQREADRGSIYRIGADATVTEIYGPLNLSSDFSISLAEGGFALNANGQIAFGTTVLDVGETNTEFEFGYSPGSISLNIHGEFARVGQVEEQRVVWVFDQEGLLVDEFHPDGLSVNSVKINDQRKVAFGNGFGVSVVDGHTGHFEHVILPSDRDYVTTVTLRDYNNAGQLALRVDSDLYLVTPVDEPNGDFTFDGRVNADDIDRLSDVMMVGSDRQLFDMNQDGMINVADRDHLLSTTLGVLPGDADLDGDVEFDDFLVLSTPT